MYIYSSPENATIGQNPDATTWQVWKITPAGAASILVQGAPLRQPNGIAIDGQGNIVVVNIGNAEVQTFTPEGKLLRTEMAAQPGNDGLVIMKDGTKYVSSVVNGGVSRIRPNQSGFWMPTQRAVCTDPSWLMNEIHALLVCTFWATPRLGTTITPRCGSYEQLSAE